MESKNVELSPSRSYQEQIFSFSCTLKGASSQTLQKAEKH